MTIRTMTHAPLPRSRWPSCARAAATSRRADREHQQIMADLRILQEQTQQLQALMTDLGEALKAVNSRIEEQTALERKAFADGKVQMDTMSGDMRVVREKVDETNVRLGTIAQELESLRDAMPQPGQFQPAPVNDDAIPRLVEHRRSGRSAGAAHAGDAAVATAGMSPQRMFDRLYADYSVGNYALAIEGFESYLRTFPKGEARARGAALRRRSASVAKERHGCRRRLRSRDRQLRGLAVGADGVLQAWRVASSGSARPRARASRTTAGQEISGFTAGGPGKAAARMVESADQIAASADCRDNGRRAELKAKRRGRQKERQDGQREQSYSRRQSRARRRAALHTRRRGSRDVESGDHRSLQGSRRAEEGGHAVASRDSVGQDRRIAAGLSDKGKQIYVEGKLQTRKWKDKDGNEKYTTEVRGDRVVLLERWRRVVMALAAVKAAAVAAPRRPERTSVTPSRAGRWRLRTTIFRSDALFADCQMRRSVDDDFLNLPICQSANSRDHLLPSIPILQPNHIIQLRRRNFEDVAVFDRRHAMDGVRRDVNALAGKHLARFQRIRASPISNSIFPFHRKIVSSLTLWYCRLSAWPALTCSTFPT